MRKGLLLLGTVVSFMSFGQDCTKLFISEYAEGEENNKALEIYNPTATSIDLSEYIIIRFSNGASTPLTTYSVQLTGTIAPYSTHVAVIDRRVNPTTSDPIIWPELEAQADAFYCPTYAVSSSLYFNGNDAVALAKGNINSPATAVLYDVFGKIGEDPGVAWTAGAPTYTPASGGAYLTKDMSLIRKATVLKGVTNPIITVFNALVEYDSIVAPYKDGTGAVVGNYNSLGTHQCNCAPASTTEKEALSVSIYPNPSNGVFTIKGTETVKLVQVVNTLGQTVATINNSSNPAMKLDLSDKKGLYFVKITDNSGNSITEKVIVK